MESVNALRRSGKSGFIRAASGNACRHEFNANATDSIAIKLLQVDAMQLTGED
jgi:hypothetical protein